mmetsp:Transcript_25886/g.76692  ORF Transcript_25886/g.76692 Transcript_25886/m.76692 type:complete len:225 (+) Transcript_25886:1700-2374(+)
MLQPCFPLDCYPAMTATCGNQDVSRNNSPATRMHAHLVALSIVQCLAVHLDVGHVLVTSVTQPKWFSTGYFGRHSSPVPSGSLHGLWAVLCACCHVLGTATRYSRFTGIAGVTTGIDPVCSNQAPQLHSGAVQPCVRLSLPVTSRTVAREHGQHVHVTLQVVDRQHAVRKQERGIRCRRHMRSPSSALRLELKAQVANEASPKIERQLHHLRLGHAQPVALKQL